MPGAARTGRGRRARHAGRGRPQLPTIGNLRFIAPDTDPLDAVHDVAARGVRWLIVTNGRRSVQVLVPTGLTIHHVDDRPIVDTIGR